MCRALIFSQSLDASRHSTPKELTDMSSFLQNVSTEDHEGRAINQMNRGRPMAMKNCAVVGRGLGFAAGEHPHFTTVNAHRVREAADRDYRSAQE